MKFATPKILAHDRQDSSAPNIDHSISDAGATVLLQKLYQASFKKSCGSLLRHYKTAKK